MVPVFCVLVNNYPIFTNFFRAESFVLRPEGVETYAEGEKTEVYAKMLK